MKITLLLLIGLSSLFVTENSFGQDSLNHKNIFPGGLSIDYGTGSFAVQDDFFSKEKYSGTLPYFKIGWSRFHDKNGFQLYLKYYGSSEIKNNQFSANVVQFSLELDYLYPVGTFSLFSKKVYAYLGPYAEFFTYYNKQNFARDGIFFDFSLAIFFSIGIHPTFIIPIRERFQFESSMQMNVLSIVIRMPEVMEVNDGNKDESSIKLLTPFSGLNSQMNFGIRYFLFKSLSIKLRYEAHVTRITSLDYLISASDNVILTITYHL